MNLKALKRQEERKRDRAWDPALRWKVIQETITWAEAQGSARRNVPAERIKEERRKLKRMRA